MRITTAALTFTSLALLAAIACSSDDDSGTPESPSSTPAVLVDLDPESAGMTVTIENLTERTDWSA